MQLGQFELITISGGRYRIDGGTMFGVVPRLLWERQFEVDEQHRIAQGTHCLLVRTGQQNILIDTGYGSKLPDKQRKHISSEPGNPLLDSLREQGFSADQIDVVVFSHLHFDHAGGATELAADGSLKLAFPNAEFVVQRREWANATSGYPELRGAYQDENLLPLRDSGRLRLIDGDVEIVPGLRALVTGGHTQGHQAIVISSEGQTAVYVGDVCATWRHLPVLWCLGYDVHMQQTRRAKAELLGRIADSDWWAYVPHDPDQAVVKLRRDSRKDFAIRESLCTGEPESVTQPQMDR